MVGGCGGEGVLDSGAKRLDRVRPSNTAAPARFELSPPRGWGRFGIVTHPVSARLGGVVAVRVVTELCEYPGADDLTDTWQGEVDFGVRVLIKRSARTVSSSLICRLSSPMIRIAAAVVAPNASARGSDATSWGAWRAPWMSVARCSRLR